MKINPKISAFAVAALVAAVAAPHANAQTTNVGDFYAGLNAGVLIPDDVSIKASANDVLGAETVTVSGNIDFDTGAAAGIFGGYHVNDWLAVEGDLQYGGIEYNSFHGVAAVTGPISGSLSSFSIKGHADTYTFLANAIVSPFGRAGWNGFSLYIGGGAGFTTFDSQLDSISSGGTTASVNESHSETDFAANAIVGVDYAVTPQISIGGRYQFLWVSLGNIIPGATNGDFTGHMLTANLTYHF